MKEKRADGELLNKISNSRDSQFGESAWKNYTTKRESLAGKAPKPTETRRAYFDTEEEATKVYASWQVHT